MASILEVNGKWRALVRRAGHKSQCKTYPTKAAAVAWARKVEAGIDAGGVADTTVSLSIKEVIQAYRKLREASRPISDSADEFYQVNRLEKHLGHLKVFKLTPDDLVGFAQMRREEKAGPHTVNMDLSKLGTVLRYGGAALKVALPDIVGAARPTLAYLRLIGGGGKRERRPTEDEFAGIITYLTEHHPQVYADATKFAASSAMRVGEIAAFKWSDINEETRVVMLYRKHPRLCKTLERVPILNKAWAILQTQQRVNEKVFPVNSQTLSTYFTWACRALSIVDLRFHDLRHESTSKMFEEGLSIQQVALVTGHKSWNMLKRYTNLKPESLVQHDLKTKPLSI